MNNQKISLIIKIVKKFNNSNNNINSPYKLNNNNIKKINLVTNYFIKFLIIFILIL